MNLPALNPVGLDQAILRHGLWDIGAWLAAVALLLLLYRGRPALFDRGSLARVQRGYFLSLPLGGLIGAYLIGSANLWLSGQPGLARSIVGGIVGAIVAVETYKARQRVAGSTGGIFAPALALGIGIGRIGCHQAGLADYTYGLPSRLPWAVDYGDGILRHPVALYESASMLLLFVVLALWLRFAPQRLLREGFYWFALVYGGQRFVWEFFKPYATLLGPFNLFHFVSAALVGYAVLMLRGVRHVGKPA